MGHGDRKPGRDLEPLDGFHDEADAEGARDGDARHPGERADPIVVGSAGGGLLPYAQGVTVSVLRSDGRKAFSWPAPGRVLALAARNGRVAVASEGSRVTVSTVAATSSASISSRAR